MNQSMAEGLAGLESGRDVLVDLSWKSSTVFLEVI